jgi:hypothetical protein
LQTRSEVLAELEFSVGDDRSAEAVVQKLGILLKEAQCSRLPARIVLADSWVRRWMVTPPQNAASLADCRAAASARFMSLYGDNLSDWHLAADWDARLPFLACAIQRSLLAALQLVADERRLVLLEVAPQFVVAWNRWRSALKAGTWFGVLHDQVLTFAVPGQSGLEVTRVVTIPDEALHDQQRMPEILAREALRLNVAAPSEIRLCGMIPAHWVMQAIGNTKFVRLDRLAAARLSAGVSLAFTGICP